ncbi:hypothetical protein [Chachezhania sediminis]|uniref:hypothetical protein n=1 Tax=Chachezhania sediminis TaxID=2599291 RepID=UPI00131E9A60|nr:hypothetical protein [Chachezhania sediminis]
MDVRRSRARRTLGSLAAVTAGIATVAIPTVAAAFIAINQLTVNPVKQGVWEVVGNAGSSPAQLWCAAGDYGLRVEKLPSSHRIYLYRARGLGETENRSNTAQFSAAPPPSGALSPGLTLDMKRVGDNMTIAFARSYCGDERDGSVWVN